MVLWQRKDTLRSQQLVSLRKQRNHQLLNNSYALQSIQNKLDVNGLRFHGQLLFTTKMVADFYDVDERTIKRYVQVHGEELRVNGYF